MWILLPQDGTQQFCKIFNWKVLRYKMCLSDFYLLTTMQCFVVVFFGLLSNTKCLFGLQRALYSPLKSHRLVWLEACPTLTIMTHGTVYTVAHLGSLLAPAGLKGQTSVTSGIEERKERGETSPTSRTKRTETICCMADHL